MLIMHRGSRGWLAFRMGIHRCKRYYWFVGWFVSVFFLIPLPFSLGLGFRDTL
jgi:hypothetical protein